MLKPLRRPLWEPQSWRAEKQRNKWMMSGVCVCAQGGSGTLNIKKKRKRQTGYV